MHIMVPKQHTHPSVVPMIVISKTIALWRKLKTVALLAFKQEKATTHKHQAGGVDVVLR